MEEPVIVRAIGVNTDRSHFSVEAPCYIKLRSLRESICIMDIANQLKKEHKVSTKHMKIVGYKGGPKQKAPKWSYQWYSIG